MNAQEWNKYWKDYFDQIYEGEYVDNPDGWAPHMLYITNKGNQLRIINETISFGNDNIHETGGDKAFMAYWPLGYYNQERSDTLFICFI